MHKNVVKIACVVPEISSQTNRQTHTDVLITIRNKYTCTQVPSWIWSMQTSLKPILQFKSEVFVFRGSGSRHTMHRSRRNLVWKSTPSVQPRMRNLTVIGKGSWHRSLLIQNFGKIFFFAPRGRQYIPITLKLGVMEHTSGSLCTPNLTLASEGDKYRSYQNS